MNDDNQTIDAAKKFTSLPQSLAMPIAIIIGFGLIAAAIYFSGNQSSQPVTDNDSAGTTATATPVNPVTETDHIQGNRQADIVLVEYSDYDCPFCRIFHDTMTKIMAEYGDTGKVAWVYRQFPIESLHPNAPQLSEASECVARLGGNDAFWQFTDALNNSRAIAYNDNGSVKSVEPTDITKLPDFVAAAGVNADDFADCMNNAAGRADVSEDYNNGVAIGVTGTPHTVVLFGDKQGEISGAQPYSSVKNIIDNLLQQAN